MKRINVAVGVIIRQGEVLLTRRHADQHQGDKWEFPGGKIEPGESLMTALARELKEELDIEIVNQACSEWMTIEHDYPDKKVCLRVCLVQDFNGEAKGMEGQPLCWVAIDHLEQYDFPQANHEIVRQLICSID